MSWGLLPGGAGAESPVAPAITGFSVAGGQQRLQFAPSPAAQEFRVSTAADLAAPWATDGTGVVTGYEWVAPVAGPVGFHRVAAVPLDERTLLTSIVLNRLAYGPTPDELERVLTGPAAIGPEAYILEQLAPETIAEDLDAPVPALDWQFVTATGTATSSTLYLYLSAAGEVHVDDLTLVRGSEPGVGANLLKNGDFEAPLAGTWTVSSNLAGSSLSSAVKRSGAASLRVVAAAGGTSRDSSLWQTVTPSLSQGQTYTLSYWYLPSQNGQNLTVRLSNSGGSATGIDTTHSLVPAEYQPGVLYARLAAGTAVLDDLRAWLVLHAVRSKRQLLEGLTYFTDNHFNTEYAKSRDFVDTYLTNQATMRQVATDFEFRELAQWRRVWLDPNGTFFDLLEISAQSPAMIVYLDTVTSKKGAPNENYSRELVELFTMGVDNGYDQTDIEAMSRAWTGWRVDKLPPGQATNPFANAVANREADPGVWTLQFRADRHDAAAKTVFKNRTVDARFGPPRAGQSYQLELPARAGNDGMQDGYDLLRHLADLPYTQEYLSVKLCRWLVHENFHHGVYDYTDPALSAEGRLVRDCLAAWERPGPDGRPGNLRAVLRVILGSDLFRQHRASQHKVRTPLEFVVSTIRALRAARPTGGFTADTDGYDVLTTLTRLNLKLFDRPDPDGYSELGRDWIGTASLVERMRFVQNFLLAPNDPLKDVDFGSSGDDNVSDPVGLLKLKLPTAQWREAGAVADFFLGLFVPGEGRANLALDRAAAVAYLDANDAGVPRASLFAALDPDTAAYAARVRSLVALLLCLPRCQEQ